MKIYVEESGELRSFEEDVSTVQIGRGQENQVVIQDPRSSRRHCRIVKTAKGFVLEDLKSRNGTLLKGQRVGRSILNVGDVFQIGKTRFHFGQKPGAAKHGGSDAPGDGGSDAPGDGGSEVPGPAVAASPAEAKPAPASKPAPADARAVPVEEVYLEGLAGVYEGQRVPITKSTYTIGRKDDNDFRLEDRRASGYHAELHCRDDAFYLVDLDSKNGTFVNGRAIKKEVRLSRGARLQIGDCQFRVHVPGPAVEEEDSDAFVDASGDYDFSRFDVDEFLQDSGGAGQPLVAVGLLVILGAVLYFVVDLSLRTVRRTNPDPNHQTNQILSNWSFEDAPAEDGEIPGWVVPTGDAARIAIEESSGVKYPGSRALALEPAAGPVMKAGSSSAPSTTRGSVSRARMTMLRDTTFPEESSTAVRWGRGSWSAGSAKSGTTPRRWDEPTPTP